MEIPVEFGSKSLVPNVDHKHVHWTLSDTGDQLVDGIHRSVTNGYRPGIHLTLSQIH